MEKDIYSTKDISLAAAYMCLGFEVVGIDYQLEGEKQNPIGYFKFTKNKDIDAAERNYLTGRLLVEPRIFMTNLKSLKAHTNCVCKSPHSKFAKK